MIRSGQGSVRWTNKKSRGESNYPAAGSSLLSNYGLQRIKRLSLAFSPQNCSLAAASVIINGRRVPAENTCAARQVLGKERGGKNERRRRQVFLFSCLQSRPARPSLLRLQSSA